MLDHLQWSFQYIPGSLGCIHSPLWERRAEEPKSKPMRLSSCLLKHNCYWCEDSATHVSSRSSNIHFTIDISHMYVYNGQTFLNSNWTISSSSSCTSLEIWLRNKSYIKRIHVLMKFGFPVLRKFGKNWVICNICTMVAIEPLRQRILCFFQQRLQGYHNAENFIIIILFVNIEGLILTCLILKTNSWLYTLKAFLITLQLL